MGGSIAYNKEEYPSLLEHAMETSPTHEVLIEESLIGWKEFEMEVMRDKKDNAIIVCSIENVDPMESILGTASPSHPSRLSMREATRR
nr:hypothetical protein [uncultured Sphaerochaeta sp.]